MKHIGRNKFTPILRIDQWLYQLPDIGNNRSQQQCHQNRNNLHMPAKCPGDDNNQKVITYPQCFKRYFRQVFAYNERNCIIRCCT